MKDINIKLLLVIVIPYLTICAGLWHIGYWSTFDINILQHLDTADIIKSFIYPFVYSVLMYFGGQIIATIFFKNSLLWQKEFKYGGAEETMHPKRLKIIRFVLSGISIIFIVIAYIFLGSDKWVWILFIIATFIGIFLNNKSFLSNVIPDRNFRLNFVYTIILIPCLSFGMAKKKSLDIFDNKNKQTTIVSVLTNQNQDTLIVDNKLKLLGITSDFVFVMTMDNKLIIMLSKSDIKQITINKNER